MMVDFENIAAPRPPVPLTDEEQIQRTAELLTEDDRWVKNFIDRLAGVIREIKH